MELKVDQSKVRELRLAKSWSQEKLAEAAGVSLRTVQRMELDGSASLKSRLKVAKALGVEPSYLDPQTQEQAPEESTQPGSEPETLHTWKELFAYPGRKTMSSKILTPLLVILWLGMMITGGLLIFSTASLGIAMLIGSEFSLEMRVVQQIFIAQIPILLNFVICFGLYRFFRRFEVNTPTSN